MIRNIAIIAHVDHGKTTLVDALLKQSGTFRDNEQITERLMDSNSLEKERGITILAKCTSVVWSGHKINIIDTPGHADFGGEVERILRIVDGVVVLVDAAEGPMPQTKFVTSKAIKLGLMPIVVINKIDRPDARCKEVLEEIFDLFIALGASDKQLDFPVLYASGREGIAGRNLQAPKTNLDPLFEEVINHVEPQPSQDGPFSFLATMLDYDPYLGRILTGRIYSGNAKVNIPVHVMDPEGNIIETSRLTKLLGFRGIERIPLDHANTADIIAIAGLSVATVGCTIASQEITHPISTIAIDPPTLVMNFSVNTSPFAGKEGTKVTSRQIRDRLMLEAETNIAIKIAEQGESFEVSGRGELQLGILVETMRREGFELSIGRPRVVFSYDEQGNKLEPEEEIQIDVDEDFSGIVIEQLSLRRGTLVEMNPSGQGKLRIVFHCPSRGLVGYYSRFLNDTRGTGIMSRIFHTYIPYKGSIEGRKNGALIASNSGITSAYALCDIEARGVLFIGPSTDVYEGMIIGEHSKSNDLIVNPTKTKQLTNIRAAGKDDAIKLIPPRTLNLEQAMAYIDQDEMIEVTPKSIRLRKIYLNPNDRKRNKSD